MLNKLIEELLAQSSSYEKKFAKLPNLIVQINKRWDHEFLSGLIFHSKETQPSSLVGFPLEIVALPDHIKYRILTVEGQHEVPKVSVSINWEFGRQFGRQVMVVGDRIAIPEGAEITGITIND